MSNSKCLQNFGYFLTKDDDRQCDIDIFEIGKMKKRFNSLNHNDAEKDSACASLLIDFLENN